MKLEDLELPKTTPMK